VTSDGSLTQDKRSERGGAASKLYTEEILNHNGIKLDSLRLKGFEDKLNSPIF